MDDARTRLAFDRAAEDVGNLVELGHLNICVPDQRLATLFYVTGLGLTRDPFLRTGVENMWVNVGAGQFHLPTNAPQVLRGLTGLVLPDLAALRRRLDSVQARLEGTCFGYSVGQDSINATCPWGNRIRCHAPDHARFGRVVRGMPYVEIDAAPGSLAGIVRFYQQVLGAAARLDLDQDGPCARVLAGPASELVFRERAAMPSFDGHHIQVTLADFSGPHRKLQALGLVTEESTQHQYRFERVIDLDMGETLSQIEHEVRSMRHPLFGRVHLNRDAERTGNGYGSEP